MFALYSLLFTFALVLLLPVLLWRRQKYAPGLRQRLGKLPEFAHDGRDVIWLHCVSVGETNAARPLVDELLRNFPDHRIIVSTTTKTGQEMAQNVFRDKAESVFYFPLDWKFSVRRVLRLFRPSVVLLMETEIWPRFFREVKRSGARLAIVNGRLSERSFRRYSLVRRFVRQLLGHLDMALMQSEPDAGRLMALGCAPAKVAVTGNIKFDQNAAESESELTGHFRDRFGVSADRPLIVAASTHSPEEKQLLEVFARLSAELRDKRPRLMIAPRHPERFDEVAGLIDSFESHQRLGTSVRRSAPPSEADKSANVILLDSIGELRAAYPLAEIVFVGGSLIPHGGQSVLEPAAAGKAIVTGPFTMNFAAVVDEFLKHDALTQLPEADYDNTSGLLFEGLKELLLNDARREELGENAMEVVEANRGAVFRTVQQLAPILIGHHAEHTERLPNE